MDASVKNQLFIICFIELSNASYNSNNLITAQNVQNGPLTTPNAI